MEVKMIKQMSVLPKVFLTPDLVKHAVTWKYLDCSKYISKSGKTFSGCLMLDIAGNEKIREVRGIYYKPADPIIKIEVEKKILKTIDDVKQFIQSLDISGLKYLNKPILFVYDNKSIYGYSKFYKGHIYEFPVIDKIGDLSIYLVPEPPDEGIEDRFTNYKEISIYDYTISSDQELRIYRLLYNSGGRALLIHTPEDLKLKIQTPENSTKEILISKHTWFLISHPRKRS